MNPNTVKYLDILQNEEVAAKIKAAASVDEVLAILADNDLVLTADELKAINAPLQSSLADDELSEDSLEMVAGGINWWKVVKAAAGVISAIAGYFA